ncbi:glycoside hydrolase family 140 protein [Dyadobacter sandarakinus]|uniref:Glycoside hydrolase family 140 protein n=1 Tax=Dyadobacter sandarakinus TaxID=2747268 RepID=A0ABX7I1I5_9BACT|nr:glycoside hydrolase family 140 protein [Dyadobacter sandarakinus]QRQ99940.1 glycoside hydrolase family 140 protein [Dyadobacter sandarakinus]
MKKLLFLSVFSFLQLYSYAQVPFAHGRLRVSDNQRYLVHQDGTPFFWLGDTAWELFHRLNREQADFYLKHRAEQGFTVIQAVALAELDGLNDPNALGERPLVNNDPAKPNEAYFQHVDYIIAKAAEYGLVIALLPTWGDKLNKSSWGKGPEIFNTANAAAFGEWMGKRYAGRQNVVWVLGGDRTPRKDTDDVKVWRMMAEGIQKGTGGAANALMSFHPQPNALDMGGSSHWFHQDAWLDFNMLQNGHCRDEITYDKIAFVYNRKPAKPVMDAEPIYEDHPVCFNAGDLGLSNAYDVRKYAYLDLFAGAFGHTYGCHDIWQMYDTGREAVNGAAVTWKQAMDLPGARQMSFVRKLMESRPMLDRVPDQSLIEVASNGPAERVQATRGKDYAMVYSASGKPFTMQMGKISGTEVNASWYDPRKGEAQSIGKVANTGRHEFKPPTSGYGKDWVLVIDDASKGYKF